ncbi:hypothetical protein Sjap_004307 [Stephania japonica]|uniref:YbaK/aminoacyl-tRNA synthetase-associated domain-containing protein n=1 Tax=Stephania japonica TaxID=461633 RepID=A0AAP0K301_9MAGN
MEAFLAELESLERVQLRVLQRISSLETSHSSSSSSSSPNPSNPTTLHESRDEPTTESRLSSLLRSNDVRDFSFKRVPPDYYDKPLESRRAILTAHSVDHLCKSIVLVNTQAQARVTDCSDRSNSKYYVVVVQRSSRIDTYWLLRSLQSQGADPQPSLVKAMPLMHVVRELKVKLSIERKKDSPIKRRRERNNGSLSDLLQYTARFNAESVKNFLYSLNNGKIPKKKFNLRLAPEEESLDLTGYEHNGVTCIGMKTSIPVILDEAIAKLQPDFFWLGGGETDLKLGIRTSEFINFVKPFVVNCSNN